MRKILKMKISKKRLKLTGILLLVGIFATVTVVVQKMGGPGYDDWFFISLIPAAITGFLVAYFKRVLEKE